MILTRTGRTAVASAIAGMVCWGALAGAADAQAAISQLSPVQGLRVQPVTQADIQALKAQVAALQGQVAALQASLANAQKAASDANFKAGAAVLWVNKNGDGAQQAAQWVAANGGAAQQAGQWVSANGAATQKVVAAYPTHVHAYNYLSTAWTNRKFVTNSHLSGDDTDYGSLVTANTSVDSTTGAPK